MEYGERVRRNNELPTGGIELIESRPRSLIELTQDELKEFFDRVKADAFTFQRYHGIKVLRVWEALALHNYLDPAVLGLNRKGRLGELKRVRFEVRPHSEHINNFVGSVVRTLHDIDRGKLVCVKDPHDLLQSFTTVANFKKYADINRVSGLLPRDFSPPKEKFDPASLPPPMGDIWEARELWKTVDQGGKVVPGRYSTQPDVEQFFRSKNYPAYQCRALASLVRPPFACSGRPPKAEWK